LSHQRHPAGARRGLCGQAPRQADEGRRGQGRVRHRMEARLLAVSAGGRLLRRALPPLAGFAALLVLLAFWQAAVALGWVSELIAPAPATIGARFLQTFAEAFAAAGLAVLVGTSLGWWLHAKPWAGRAYESWVATFAAAP